MSDPPAPTAAERLLSVKTTRDLAAFVGVTHETFTFLLYRKPELERYRSFIIKKKNGKDRQIEAPIKPIRRMQEALMVAFVELYKPRQWGMSQRQLNL